MPQNSKLTEILKGRTIGGTGNASGEMHLHFTDGSVMTLKTANTGSHSAATGGTVKSVTQDGTRLTLVLEGEDRQDITLAEATGSVHLHDKNNTLEYED